MEAMIFAAGLGTRLYPLTADRPKALVEVNGITLLQRCISRLTQYGFNRIVINIHHHADKVIDFVHCHNFDAEIVFSDERNLLLDTGGGLKKASKLFTENTPILIHNVDVLSDINLTDLYNYHCQNNALATLAVAERDTSRYLLFDKEKNLCGWTNRKTGETIWAKNCNDNATPLAFSGIHVVNPDLTTLLPTEASYPIIPQYLEIAQHNTIKAYLHTADQWLDVGKPEALAKAETFVIEHHQ
jgi:NDP-sugar pyrophosphorylase family protein